MKRIGLTQGQYAIVDDEDYKWLIHWKWCAFWNKYTKSFYAVRTGKRKNGKRPTIYMSREILKLKYGDKRQCDHINHNTLDNQKLNLRIVTQQQNQWNKKKIIKGYFWEKRREKYRANIRLNNKCIHLGYFLTPKEAHEAYLRAKPHYHKLPQSCHS